MRRWSKLALLGLIVPAAIVACTLNPQPLPPGEQPDASTPTVGGGSGDDGTPGSVDSGTLSPTSDASAAFDSGGQSGGGSDAGIDAAPPAGDAAVGDASHGDGGDRGDGGDSGDAAVDAPGDALADGDSHD